jgi:hypothetical protein
MLVKVKKRSAILQEFDKAKLKTLEKAEPEKNTRQKVAEKVASKVKEGTTTVEIREWTTTELKPMDPKAVKASNICCCSLQCVSSNQKNTCWGFLAVFLMLFLV